MASPLVRSLPALLILAGCAGPRPAAPDVRLDDARGVQLEEADVSPTAGGALLTARMRDPGLWSSVRREAVVFAIEPGGERREVGRTRVELVPFDRAPTRRSRVGTIRTTIPDEAVGLPLEVAILPGR
jgi:hypothetical protein